jgi:hypothetical protein
MAAAIPALRLYFPLWGLRFDSDGVAGIGRGIAVYVPEAEEWLTIQKTDVWKAQWGSEPRLEGPTPPCCIVVSTPLGAADSIYDAIEARGTQLLRVANDAVTALRLFRAGWFLHPVQAMYVFEAPLAPNVARAPGPYRQAFVSGQAPLARFELRIEDLTRTLDAPGPIAATWSLLESYRRTPGNASVEIAIESFNQSYGFQLRPMSRAGNLFTSLDAMLGGMRAWKIGRVPVKPRGYARRLESALRTSAAGEAAGDARESARWLESSRGGRGLRNAIAHGADEALDETANDAHERLQAIVRAVLGQYLHFATRWAEGGVETAARLGLHAESPLAAAYVTTLAAEVKAPGSMLDLLQPGRP